MNEIDAGRPVDQEADRLYSFVGQYVAIFQWMEAQLDQILLLAYGHENWNWGQVLHCHIPASGSRILCFMIAALRSAGVLPPRDGATKPWGPIVPPRRPDAGDLNRKALPPINTCGNARLANCHVLTPAMCMRFLQ